MNLLQKNYYTILISTQFANYVAGVKLELLICLVLKVPGFGYNESKSQ